MIRILSVAVLSAFIATPSLAREYRQHRIPGEIDAMVARHASANGVPLELARRVVMRESGGNPRASNAGNYGLMQIWLGTARAMGYSGSAAGLLDPETNLTYAMKYLAGAHRVAGGNHDRAVMNYARGYYYAAKRQGWSPYADGATAPRRGRDASSEFASPRGSDAYAYAGTDSHKPDYLDIVEIDQPRRPVRKRQRH